MAVLRWFALLLITAFFVLSLVATFPLPIFVLSLNGLYDQSGNVVITMWSSQTDTVSIDTGVAGQNFLAPKVNGVRINYMNCTEKRSQFRAMQAFSISGTVLGFYAMLLCLLMCICKLKVKLPLFIFTLLAFISELMLVIMTIIVYTKSACDGKLNSVAAYKATGYKFGIAFFLQIVACVGYLVCVILTPFTQDLWCGRR